MPRASLKASRLSRGYACGPLIGMGHFEHVSLPKRLANDLQSYREWPVCTDVIEPTRQADARETCTQGRLSLSASCSFCSQNRW